MSESILARHLESHGLELVSDRSKYRTVVATRRLKAGDAVMRSRALCNPVLFPTHRSQHCETCFKTRIPASAAAAAAATTTTRWKRQWKRAQREWRRHWPLFPLQPPLGPTQRSLWSHRNPRSARADDCCTSPRSKQINLKEIWKQQQVGQNVGLVNRLLFILTYFIRCSEVFESLEQLEGSNPRGPSRAHDKRSNEDERDSGNYSTDTSDGRNSHHDVDSENDPAVKPVDIVSLLDSFRMGDDWEYGLNLFSYFYLFFLSNRSSEKPAPLRQQRATNLNLTGGFGMPFDSSLLNFDSSLLNFESDDCHHHSHSHSHSHSHHHHLDDTATTNAPATLQPSQGILHRSLSNNSSATNGSHLLGTSPGRAPSPYATLPGKVQQKELHFLNNKNKK